MFEIGKNYVMLIKNEEKEFAHIVNKEMKFDQIIIEFRNCGILLNPLNEDLIAYGYQLKVKYYISRKKKQRIGLSKILLWLQEPMR